MSNKGYQPPEDTSFRPVPSGAFPDPTSATAPGAIDVEYLTAFVKGSTQAVAIGYSEGYAHGLSCKGGFIQPLPATSTGFIDQQESRAFGEGYAHGFSGGFAAGYAQGIEKVREQSEIGGFAQNHGFKPETGN